jgi:hypothetical protein
MVPCGEGGCTAYRSHRIRRTQQEGSKCEANPNGFGEGSPNPHMLKKKIAKNMFATL